MATYSYTRIVQWGECDPAGIIFFPRYAEWMVEGLNAMFFAIGFDPTATLAGGSMRGTPCVAYASTFHAAPKLHERVTHQISVTRVGRTSVTVGHSFLRGKQLLAEVEDTRVFVVVENGSITPTPVPDDVRSRLADPDAVILAESPGPGFRAAEG